MLVENLSPSYHSIQGYCFWGVSPFSPSWAIFFLKKEQFAILLHSAFQYQIDFHKEEKKEHSLLDQAKGLSVPTQHDVQFIELNLRSPLPPYQACSWCLLWCVHLGLRLPEVWHWRLPSCTLSFKGIMRPTCTVSADFQGTTPAHWCLLFHLSDWAELSGVLLCLPDGCFDSSSLACFWAPA